MKKISILLCLISCFLEIQAQTLLAHYPLNGNANDIAGSLNGTVSGATLTTDRTNSTNSCYSFNGTGNHINLGNSSVLKPTTGLTVSLWFELNSTGILTGRSMVSCTENAGYAIHSLSNNTIECVVRRNGSYGSVAVSATPYDNTGWHFAVMTYDGRFLKLYMDGQLAGTNDAGAVHPITYVTTNTYIGADPSGASGIDGNFYYKGKLDDVKIYNGALSAAEITSEYLNNKPIPAVGLQLWLRADTGLTKNGNNIVQWNDISGNNTNAVQPLSSRQPELVEHAMNGRSVARFDGVDDLLQTASLDLTATAKATVFIVNRADNEAVSVETSRDVNSNNNGFSILENYDYGPVGISAILKGNAAGPFNNFTSSFRSTNTFTIPKICYVAYDKTQSSYLNQIKMRVNGADMTNTNGYGGTHSDNFGNDSIFIGGRGTGLYPLHGDIAEVIIYNRLLTTSERTQVENYLNLRYAVSTVLAQNQPGSGNTINYDGTNDYVSFPSPSFTAYTIESWVKFTGSPINKNVLVFTNSSGPGTSWSHQIRTNSSGRFEHYTYDGAENTVQGNTAISQNKWYHVCITGQNNGTAKLFVNGIEEGTPASVGTLWTPGTEFRIGVSTGGGAGLLAGQVDEVRVWNTVLTPAQIRERMCRKITAEDSLYSRLVLNLNFDEMTGNTVYDLSSNGRNGTLINGPTRLTSGAPIGNKSSYSYNGASSSTFLSNAALGDFTASMTGGTAGGMHLYSVTENPNVLNGIDSVSSNQGYFGVFVANGVSPSYTARYHYNGTGGFQSESYLNLYTRTDNAITAWSNANAILNTDSNTLIVTGQNTEYVLGAHPILQTYYRDTDGDGFGNPADSLLDYIAPLNYVTNNTDCNDADSLEHPGQIWYMDADGDQYGSGLFITQCTRPSQGFVASELTAIAGDCDDNDLQIFPGYQHFEFSGTGNYSNAVISPTNGDSYTTFSFEVMYKDASGAFPPATFPRVLLDYEGNGVLNNPNDRTVFMTEDDLHDTNTVDGKKYIATINGLPTGTNWKTRIQTNLTPCGSNFGPFDYPDVLVRPDLEIFANDISFSVPHPPVSSPMTVSATIHNVSDFTAQNFIVHLADQYDLNTSYADITVPTLAPHSSTTVSWSFVTVAVPSWHPLQVSIDYSDTIDESNELDNVALRPYINGNYNLPGSIISNVTASPAVSYTGINSYITLSGSAHYSGTAVPLTDSGVAGATVTFTIMETGASYTTYTNSNGHISYSFPKPLAPGVYHIEGTCTDYTLTGTLSTQFELIAPVISICQLPNLTVNVYVSSNEIVLGDVITGNFIVKNTGMTTSIPTILSVAQSGGTPQISNSFNIPSLAQFESDTIPFSITFNALGQFSICAMADATYIENECFENNSSCQIIYVFPPLPDIIPGSGPTGSAYQCLVSNAGFTLYNIGGVASGPFNCRIVTKLNGNIINTANQMVSDILPIQYAPSNKVVVNIPFVPPSTGNYTFELFADNPVNDVTELNELNNNATYSLTAVACKPDFRFYGCENFNVESADGQYAQGSDITLKAVLANGGNLAYNGPVTVRFALSSGIQYDTVVQVNLSTGSYVNLSKIISAPQPASVILTVTADPTNQIAELSEANNSVSNSMCWDFEPVPYCSHNFWDDTYLVNQAVFLSVGVRSDALYDADTLKVKFEVSGPGLSGTINLGNGIMQHVRQTCFCPTGVTLPINFAFPQTGTYTFTMTTDPDNEYAECDEFNNILVKTVHVTSLPDMRILSQHIAPSSLNPDPNEAITMNVTYENKGASNINDQMKLRVIVDNTPLDSIYPVNGLTHNGNTTFAIPSTWASSLVGVHVIRAIIDDDNQIAETNELNNEATRAIVVGESANLYFQVFTSNTLTPVINDSMTIHTRIGNSGDLACSADVQLFYVDDILDTILITTNHISVNAHDSISFSTFWKVLDHQTTLFGKIVNANILEYTYDDNQASFQIGKMYVLTKVIPACADSNTTGSISTYVVGGNPPYTYFWNTGSNGASINAPAGQYTITVSDQTGQSVTNSASIPPCPEVSLHLRLFLQGYSTGAQLMTPTLVNEGRISWPTDVDSVWVELHKDTIGYPLVDSYRCIVQTDGTMNCYFDSPGLVGELYYIVLKHRNSTETWSAAPIVLSAQCTYDFSDMAGKAYGNNQADISGNGSSWAIYTGDINGDDNIDLLDLSLMEVDINNFEAGYLSTDLNGDGNVDLLDNPLLEENISNFIFAIRP